jgi:hypothetical protein
LDGNSCMMQRVYLHFLFTLTSFLQAIKDTLAHSEIVMCMLTFLSQTFRMWITHLPEGMSSPVIHTSNMPA